MERFALALIGLLAVVGCEGDQGPAGSAGTNWPGDTPAAYTSADGIAGGAAYSKWWISDAGGSGTQPTTTAGADFYRCKACHGWDGLGNAGSYADRTGQSTLKSSRPDVSAVNLRSTAEKAGFQQMYDLVAHAGGRDIDAADNRHPDFSSNLTDAQIWNLVKFMREEWIAPNLLYDIEVTGPAMYVDYSADPDTLVTPTITYTNVGALGNEAAGEAIASARCAACHGADGTTLDIGGRSLGQFIRQKPHEAWQKVKFGESGTGMAPGAVTSISEMQSLYKALANPTNYPDL